MPHMKICKWQFLLLYGLVIPHMPIESLGLLPFEIDCYTDLPWLQYFQFLNLKWEETKDREARKKNQGQGSKEGRKKKKGEKKKKG